MLRINNDYSVEEIADALKVSVPAAKARLYRAQHRLKIFFPYMVVAILNDHRH